MRRGSTGHAVTTTTAGEVVQAFVPNPLPPVPPLAWSPSLRKLHDAALLACGRLDGVLDGVSVQVPEISNRLLYAYVRREALLLSQIEGTQSCLSDLLLFELDEAPGAPWLRLSTGCISRPSTRFWTVTGITHCWMKFARG